MTFDSLGLSPELLRALVGLGHDTPTPVQQAAIPPALEGRDLLAAAQTGTGKTGGFALPLLQRLQGGRRPGKAPRALVLTPTRELAMQVQESVQAYGRHLSLRSLAVFGGVGIGGQRQALARGVDVLVATPGRLLDHLGQGSLDLSKIELLVLDEADRMLDMGFLPALKRVLAALPAERQTLLFSATFAPAIRELAGRFLRDPLDIQITPPNAAATTVHHVVHPVDKERKRDLLIHLMAADSQRQTLVFSRTKHGADRLCKQLERAGFRAAAIHGNRSQNQRVRALTGFKNGDITVLVATDIAARGLDIEQLPVVINHDLPNVPEDYVHRIGRTGRAGADGLALSLVSHDEAGLLRDIVRVLGKEIRVEAVDGFEPPQPLPTLQPTPHGHRNGSPAAPGAARSGRRRRRRGGGDSGQREQGQRR